MRNPVVLKHEEYNERLLRHYSYKLTVYIVCFVNPRIVL